ncbi:Transposon Ty3-I Gag-Pol polyprotein [Nymphon striatum]|nr:Transposon Ty3-I Gag-Pol polyprotein [Nymphon striatum]
MQRFEEFFVGETHEAFESYKFHMRKQEPSETIEAYVGALRQLAKNCNFDKLENRMIRDQVVVGVRDDLIREKLQEDRGLTLDRCLTVGRAYEASIKIYVFCRYGRVTNPTSSENKFVQGKVEVTLTTRTSKCNQDLYVVKHLSEPLLGKLAIEALKLIERVNLINQQNSFKKDFPKLFIGLGRLENEYKIHLQEGCQPFSIAAPRRIPIPLKEKVNNELKLVPKQDGKIRLCVDFTKFNESVKRQNFPLPTTDQLLSELEGATVFSKLDCNKGFCYTRLPFGISSGPEIFQREMCHILSGMPGVVCDIDDVLVSGRNQKEHDSRLREVLSRTQSAGITLNDKCLFSVGELKFLGHIISKEGIEIDPGKVIAIKRFPKPKDVSEIRRLMGIVNHVDSDLNSRNVSLGALGVTWCCERFSEFLIGLPNFLIETDHKPLLAILKSKRLDELTPRLQRYRLRMMRFSYEVQHVPGKSLHTADALSRAPVDIQSDDEFNKECEVEAHVNMIMQALPASNARLDEIRIKQLEDNVCSQLVTFCKLDCWPNWAQTHPDLKIYWNQQQYLTVTEGLLLYQSRIVIPNDLRTSILEKIHEGHQGITKCRALARESVWWPGLSSELKNLVENSREFLNFTNCYNFTHITSSPHHPQGNGEAERAVQTVKNLLQKSSDPYAALLNYRASPLQQGKSPAEVLMGRKIQTKIPAFRKHDKSLAEFKSRDVKIKQKQKKSFDETHKTKEMSPLKIQQPVWIKTPKTTPATIKKFINSRSTLLSTPTGIVRRNRNHLRIRDESTPIENSAVPRENQTLPNTQEETSGASDFEEEEISVPNCVLVNPECVSASKDNGQKSNISSFGRKIKRPERMNL